MYKRQPLLLLFLFAVVDLGRSVFLSMALDDAAHAVCEAASGHPAGDVAESQLSLIHIYALMSASHHIQMTMPGSVADVFLY